MLMLPGAELTNAAPWCYDRLIQGVITLLFIHDDTLCVHANGIYCRPTVCCASSINSLRKQILSYVTVGYTIALVVNMLSQTSAATSRLLRWDRFFIIRANRNVLFLQRIGHMIGVK